MEGQKPQEFIEISGVVLGVQVFLWVSLTEAWMGSANHSRGLWSSSVLSSIPELGKVEGKSYRWIPHIQVPPPPYLNPRSLAKLQQHSRGPTRENSQGWWNTRFTQHKLDNQGQAKTLPKTQGRNDYLNGDVVRNPVSLFWGSSPFHIWHHFQCDVVGKAHAFKDVGNGLEMQPCHLAPLESYLARNSSQNSTFSSVKKETIITLHKCVWGWEDKGPAQSGPRWTQLCWLDPVTTSVPSVKWEQK